MPQAPQRDVDLASLRWERRPLLIFAPFVDHDGYGRQKQMLAAQQGGVENRNITLIEVVGRDAGYVNDEPLSPDSAAKLRSDFNVGIDDFTVILVGKDGGEKLRERSAVPAHRLFELIDSMPMRQAEMRQ